MAEIQVKTKVLFKHKTAAQWASLSYIPNEGEIIVYDKEDNNGVYRLKVGDGATVAKDLPFLDDRYYTKEESDAEVLITTAEIDEICGQTIMNANEVEY